MPAHIERKSTKKVKKVKKAKRSIEQPVNLEGTKRIKTMAPIRKLRGTKNGQTTTTTTNSPLVNNHNQPRRQNSGRGNLNGNPQGQQQNSKGNPSPKEDFIAEGGHYGKNNGHQTVHIQSGSKPQLRPRVKQPPVQTAEEQENQKNLMKEALQRVSSQVSFDTQLLENEQLGVVTREYDLRTTMPTPIPTAPESTTSAFPPVTTIMTPTQNLIFLYVLLGIAAFLAGGTVVMCFKFIGNCFRRIFNKNQTDDSPPPLPIAAPPTTSPKKSFWDWLFFWRRREPNSDELVHQDKNYYKKNSRRLTSTVRRGSSENQHLVNNELDSSPTVPKQLRTTGKDIMNKKNNEEQKHDDGADVKDYEDIMKQTVQDEESLSEMQSHGYNEHVGGPTDSELEKALKELREAGKGSMSKEEPEPSRKNNEEQNNDEDAAVKQFEDSLKRTVEDEEKSKENQKRLKELEEQTKRMLVFGDFCGYQGCNTESCGRWKQLKEQENQHRKESSSDAGDFAEADEMDRQFREKLAEQNREFNEKMEELKRQRREKQRLANEEYQEERRQMQLRIAAILACMQLKQRFLEKKEEWEDFLRKLRELLVKIINSYYDFQKEIKNFDSTDEFSQGFLDSEGEMFAKKVANAQHMFSNAFNNLKALTEDYDDRIFIKMIMKSISKQAHLCSDVGEELVIVLEQGSKDIKKLDELVSRIDSQGIPTTGRLTNDSVNAREEDYANIQDVSLPEWFRYFM